MQSQKTMLKIFQFTIFLKVISTNYWNTL